jgi:DEAD/DEAH box helicase domain-containing protein
LNAAKFIDRLVSSRYYKDQIIHIEELPPREAVFGTLEKPVSQAIQSVLTEMGITNLYSHQVSAIEALRSGRDVVVVTSTASGKTLCYNIPVLETLLDDPSVRALYMFPTKALAQDQLRGLTRFKNLNPDLPIMAGTYDGDTPANMRKKLRDEGTIILTNPDMLHQGILPHHPSWSKFFANLRYVVIDEVHTYRGVFGSQVANVVRRLERVCRLYGSRPQYVCCSATIANPKEHADRITGRDTMLIDNDGAPKGSKRFVFWNPPFIDDTKMERRSANAEAKDIMVELLKERIQTIAFVKARIVAELLYKYVQEDLQKYGPSLANCVKPYRGGYLPEERREIERRLFSGELLGVTSTNALELGIDVGSLDASIIVGYPGTIASTWQQAGRAGRSKEESLAVLIGLNTPIDQYMMRHPDYFFGQNPENAIIDPHNPYVTVGHVRAAAYEAPISGADYEWFGEYLPSILEMLEDQKELRRAGNQWFWIGKGYPADDVKLRSMSDDTYTIVDTTSDNTVIGTICESSAFEQVHPEAIYLHDGESYYVDNLDLKQKVAYVKKTDTDYFTQSITERRVDIEDAEEERRFRESTLFFGDITVTSQVFMFKKIRFFSRDSIGYGKIDLPQVAMQTSSFWLVPPLETLKLVKDFGREPTEGMLGIANAAGAVVPVFAMCDSMDIGTVVDASNTGVTTLFIYDRYPGGVGFAQKCYRDAEHILEACLELIQNCECENGCPSCVGSPIPPSFINDPDLTSRGKIPDKEAALVLLHSLLGLEPYIPKRPRPEVFDIGPAGGARAAGGLGAQAPGFSQTPQSVPPMPEGKPLPINVEMRLRRRLAEKRSFGS